MKAFKWIWVSLMILCLLCPAFSLAEAGEPRFCLPEEVDLSQVQEIDGRLKGEILLPSREGDSGSYRLLVDCPVPQGFSAKQQVRLQVEYQKIEKQQMSEALSSFQQLRLGQPFPLLFQHRCGYQRQRFLFPSLHGPALPKPVRRA